MFRKRKKLTQTHTITETYEDRIITAIEVKKETEDVIKIEYLLESEENEESKKDTAKIRVFLKRFNKYSTEYMNEWSRRKIGDEVTLLIYPDGIIRDIF